MEEITWHDNQTDEGMVLIVMIAIGKVLEYRNIGMCGDDASQQAESGRMDRN